jgi:8-oxo-dGTP pyrophosphatase MutT (NUDIX family)
LITADSAVTSAALSADRTQPAHGCPVAPSAQGEEPAECLAREIREELAWDAAVGEPFHTWSYRVFPHRHVFVLTFLATYDGAAAPVYSHEHKELILVAPDEVGALNLPEGYRTAIRLAVERGYFQQG